MRRVTWRVVPLLMFAYLIAVVDRANVGFAKLQMVKSLGMTEQAYGFAASLFFVGYLVFEVPSTLAVHRFGARKWLARILFTWGVVTVLIGFASSSTIFTVFRFLLGVAEAGAYPGIIFFVSLWFPQAYRVGVMGIVTLGSAFGNLLGSVMAGALLDLDGLAGLRGWQWVFIATGLPAVLMSIVILRGLPDTPAQASFLSDGERRVLTEALGRENTGRPDGHGIWAVLWDPRVLILSLCYTLILTSLYGVIYWLPTVVKGFGASGTQNGLLSAFPWAVTAVALFIIPGRLRTLGAVLGAMAVLSAAGLVGFVASTLAGDNALRLLAIVIGTPCISLLLPCFWSVPSRFVSGARAAAAIGAISTVGNLGGFLAQNAMPWVADRTGSAVGAMLVPAACLALLATTTAVMFYRQKRRTASEKLFV